MTPDAAGEALRPRQQSRGTASQGEARKQLAWIAWMRIVVVSTAFITTVLLDVAIRPDHLPMVETRVLYAIFLGAYALSGLNLASLALLRETSLVAAIQFGGDVLVETALFHAIVPALGYDASIAVAMALFFLTTIFACTYLDRIEGAALATGAFLLQVAVHVLPRTDAFAGLASPLASARIEDVARNLFVLMFTFYGTAWLVASRAERLRSTEDSLKVVTDEYGELQAFNEHVIQSMGAGLVTTDEEASITFANPAAGRLLDARPRDLQGRNLYDVLGLPERLAEDIGPLRRGRSLHRFGRETSLRGGRVSLEVAVSRLEDAEGRGLGLLFLLEDVTELRALEQEIRLKEKMAAIGEMAAGIAHEIRNPLASISGSVQILHRQLDLDGERARLMDIVLAESRRLDTTIKGFLDFARPRAPRRRAVDLTAMARETITLLSHSEEVLEAHRLAVPTGESVEIHADPDQVRQVLWNLCQNALKAMPEGGTLSVSVTRDGEAASLVVSDTGHGMSEEARARAFQPLTGEFRDGTGLGLAIVYRIVKDHGGQVLIDSHVGAGTRIEVRLAAHGGADAA